MIFRRASPPSHLVEDVVLALTAAGLTLVVPPADAGPSRTAYRAVSAALGGVFVGRSVRDVLVPRGTPVALGLVTAAATWALADTTESWDGRSDDALRRRGLSRPREVVAALLAGGLLGIAVVEHRSRDDRPPLGCDPEPPEVLAPLDESVRRVVADVLSGYDGLDAPALRQQLAVARQVQRAPDEVPDSWVSLSVPPDAPRAFPSEFRFPVSARSTSPAGVALTTRVSVVDGVLDTVDTVPVDLLDPRARDEALPGFPELTDWTLVLDDPRGPTERTDQG